MKQVIICGKGILDGATTLEQAVEQVLEYRDYLVLLQKRGWKLTGPVQDDHGYLYKEQPHLVIAYSADAE